jgi:chromosome segregation ATPase
MPEERFERIDLKFTELDQRLDVLQANMDLRFTEVKTDMDRHSEELRRFMGVLHEEALERIAGTRESATASVETSAESKDEIGRRLDPLEALVPVVREHSATLQRHDAEIERLKRRRR